MYPHYQVPRSVLAEMLRDWVFLRHRNFRADAQTCVATLGSQLKVTGLENIPADRPYAVVFNHYYRPGFAVWWLAMAIAASLPDDGHMVMTGELTSWYRPVGEPLSRIVLSRLARVYGFTLMPPMPPRPQDVKARAHAVRQVLAHLSRAERPILLFAPEGQDNYAGGVLAWPPSGVGRFLLRVAGKGLAFIPVGGWDEPGALHIRLGPGFRLEVPAHLDSDAKDRAASRSVMLAIAAQLPVHLRGDFGAEILTL